MKDVKDMASINGKKIKDVAANTGMKKIAKCIGKY